jgi:hypothetical protein
MSIHEKDNELIWEEYLTEMPNFEVDNKTVKDTDTGEAIKDMTVKQIEPNIALLYSDKPSFFGDAGFFVLMFTQTEDYAEKIKSGEVQPIVIPQGTPMSRNSAPYFARLWRQKHLKPYLGIVQGYVKDDIIYVDYMTVPSKARRNKINTLMLNTLKNEFPNRKIETSERTPDGEKFWKNYNK